MALHVFGQMVYYYKTMCWKCGKNIEFSGQVGRGDTCPSCGFDLRSCKNCRHYSPGGYHDCAERMEDAPQDKERANFCDFFSLKHDFSGGGTGQDEQARRAAARAAFNNLFS